jgi:TolB-like protein/class 3 adenylate cyclase
MSDGRVERRLAAILAADVAGYSRLMGADEEGPLERLKALRRELADPKIAAHKGRIVKTTGDGMLVEFASVVDAVRCAVEMQTALAKSNDPMPPDQRIEWRIGINVGDIVVEDGDIFGDGVNVAARLEGLAEVGGICVSARVREDAVGKLDLAFEDIGEQVLKNIARPVRVYRVGPRASGPQAAGTAAVPLALALPDKPSIAVLPFANMSGDPEQEYFVDGMVEEIITALSRIRWLFVIARNSSFSYKGQSPDVRQVGRELGERYVLEGSVRKAGNRMRITAQLIDTSSGAHIWADGFDGSLDDIFDLQDRVASNVAGVIEPTLRKAEFERVSRKPTESLDAYDLYLRALALRDTHTDESVNEAVTLLKRALAIDPNYAPAEALIGWSRVHQRSHGRSPVSEADAAEAVVLARQALEIGKEDPDTLWMAATTLAIFAGEHAVAAAAIDRALMLNPNSAHAWAARGFVCRSRDQSGPAIEAFERAMRLSPFDRLRRTFTVGIAIAHLAAGRYEQAAEWAEQTLREEPGYRAALSCKTAACALLDRVDDARATLSQMIEAQPGLTIARYSAFWSRIFSPALLAIWLTGLRKAGVARGMTANRRPAAIVRARCGKIGVGAGVSWPAGARDWSGGGFAVDRQPFVDRGDGGIDDRVMHAELRADHLHQPVGALDIGGAVEERPRRRGRPDQIVGGGGVFLERHQIIGRRP